MQPLGMQRISVVTCLLGRVESKRVLKRIRRHQPKSNVPKDAVTAEATAYVHFWLFISSNRVFRFELLPEEVVSAHRGASGFVKRIGPIDGIPFTV